MFKKVVAIASVAALVAATTPAFAHGYRDSGWRHGHSDRGPNGALIALGAFAAFAGAAAILSSQQAPPPAVVYAPPPAYVPAPAPAYYAPAYAPAPGYYAPAPVYPAYNYPVDNR